MLSRRHLRIKVLQALYGAEENSTTSVGVKEKNLFKSIVGDKDLTVEYRDRPKLWLPAQCDRFQ